MRRLVTAVALCAVLTLSGAANAPTPHGDIQSAAASTASTASRSVSISVGDAALVEGNSGARRVLLFPVSLSAPATAPVSVSYSLADGTAIAPGDYSTFAGTKPLNFAASTDASTPVVRYVSVPVAPDVLSEPNETFTITLSAPTGGSTLGRAVGTGRILNDDPGTGAQISIGAGAIVEGNTGALRALWLPITLSAPPHAAVSVQYTVTNATATAPDDYANVAPTTVNFPATTNGTTPVVKYARVSIRPDTLVETNETLRFTLSAPTGGYTLGRSVGIGTILNDDAPSAYTTTNGSHYVVGGKAFVAYGSTMYPYWSFGGRYLRGDGWHHPEFTQYIDTIIAMAKQAHLNVIRPTDYLEGDTNAFDPVVWENMNYLVNQSAANGLMIIMDLSAYRKFLQAQNTYAYSATLWYTFVDFVGARYANSTNVLTYSISGEAPCPNGNDALRPSSTAGLTNFYSLVSTRLHTADEGHHLLEAGGFIHLNQSDCGIDWQTIYALPYVHAATIHVYSDNDRSITVPMVSSWAASKGYPFEIQEFGFLQSVGDSTRASDYQATYDLATNNGAAMKVFWNLGPEIAPTSYEVSPATPLTWQTVIANAP